MDDCAPIANGAEAHAMLPSFSRKRRWRRSSCALILAGKHWTNGGAAASCQKCDALRRDRRPSEHTPHACSPVFMPKQTVRSAAVGRAAITGVSARRCNTHACARCIRDASATRTYNTLGAAALPFTSTRRPRISLLASLAPVPTQQHSRTHRARAISLLSHACMQPKHLRG